MASPLEAFLSGKERGQGIQQQQQEFDAGQADMELQRGKLLLNSINAIQGATADPARRMQLAQQAAPELSKLGINIDFNSLSLADFTDQGLEERKAVLAGAIPQMETNIQQATAIPGVGFQTLSRSGDVELRTLPEEEQKRISDAFEAEAQRKAQAAGGRAAATEEAKLSVQKEIKPEIERGILTARQEAENRGEALSDLAKARAALPGVRQVVSQLRKLAAIATSTFSGKAFDVAAKEVGFGATKGSTARAKYIAIIDNELLPLLRQTFGSAFTAEEGNRLKATLGDPNATPDEKNAQLDAFIESKMRQIETREREIGVRDIDLGPPSVTTQAEFDALPSGAVFIEDGVEYRKP